MKMKTARKLFFVSLATIGIIIISMSLFLSSQNMTAKAASDPISANYNFNIDNNVFDISWTPDAMKHNIYDLENHKLGTTYVDVGRAISKTKIDGFTYFSYLFNVTTSPYKTSNSDVGGLDRVEIETKFSSDIEYLISSPTISTSDVNWTVGTSVGTDTSISATYSYNGSDISVANTSNRSTGEIFVSTGIVFPWYLITSTTRCFTLGAMQDNHFQYIISCRTKRTDYASSIFTFRSLYCRYTPLFWGWARANSVGVEQKYAFSVKL